VGAELFKPLVEVPILTDEDLLHGSLHVVIDAAPRDAAEELESPHVGVENHLLGFSRVGDDKTHPAVAESDMRHLDPSWQSAKENVLMAPIELKRFSRVAVLMGDITRGSPQPARMLSKIPSLSCVVGREVIQPGYPKDKGDRSNTAYPLEIYWSGRGDLDTRHPAPKAKM